MCPKYKPPGDGGGPEPMPGAVKSIPTDDVIVSGIAELHARVLGGAECPICETPTSPWSCSCGCLRLTLTAGLADDLHAEGRCSA